MRLFFVCVVAIFAFTQLQGSSRDCSRSLESATIAQLAASSIVSATHTCGAAANTSPVACDTSQNNDEGEQDDDANDALVLSPRTTTRQETLALSVFPVRCLLAGFDESEPALRPPRA
ncbi:MAG: hypothetical protein IPK60_06770 [Sandaracinaceae bacterium]|nr:hypothetical protein [Sandaracinaceae bacterium]